VAGRIYISPITGDGTGENAYRGLICTLANVTRCRSAISSIAEGTDRGKPARSWTLVYVDCASGDWSAVEANNQVRLIRLEESPDDVMPNLIRNRITQGGALTADEMPAGMTFRQALQAMLNKHYPDATLHAQFPEIFPEGE
jgi:hypothetical protein